MMITRELGTQTKLSTRQGKIAERKRPREAEDEPMEEELAATGTPQNSKSKGNTTTDPSVSPIPSTSGTQHHISAPVSMLLTKEDRDMQFEISQEVLDELNQERENELFSLVAWESAALDEEDCDLSSPIPDIITE